MSALNAGTPVPNFTLHSTPDQLVCLSDLRGKPVVLVFYPADWSPVCSDQLALYNELLPEFYEFDAQILGISVDGERVQKSLGKKLRFVFRNFPLTQAHPYALVAAEAAEAAGLQEKFWEMHDFIYEHQDDLEPDVLPAWAGRVGLDLEEFWAAIRQGEITQKIKADRMSGIQSGVNGTPCFFINGARYDGTADYEPLHAALQERLNL